MKSMEELIRRIMDAVSRAGGLYTRPDARQQLTDELTPVFQAALAQHLAANTVVSRDTLALLRQVAEQQGDPLIQIEVLGNASAFAGSIEDGDDVTLARFGTGDSDHKTPEAALNSLLTPVEPEPAEPSAIHVDIGIPLDGLKEFAISMSRASARLFGSTDTGCSEDAEDAIYTPANLMVNDSRDMPDTFALEMGDDIFTVTRKEKTNALPADR